MRFLSSEIFQKRQKNYFKQTSAMAEKKQPKPKCWNCKFAGDQFKVGTLTHVHCFEPTQYPEERLEAGEVSPWETLREGWDTCSFHQFKEPAAEAVAQ